MNGSADNALGIYISDSVLPVEVHLLQLCFGGVSGQRPWALCGAGDRGPGRRAERGPERWERSCRGAWTRCTWAEERRRCWRRSCWQGCLPRCARSSTLDADAEITVECAPGQIADATLEAMAAAGVNRVSLGVQSFVDSEAHASGRLHNRATVEEDLRRLRAAGIANLNVDLIAGLAGQTFASWEESLAALIESGVPHASVYMLEVDEDSRLGREVLKGGARYRAGLVPDDDAIARMYDRAIERLDAAGLRQYEISNFCLPGFYSWHNLRYWQRRPYLGVGLDASSMLLCDSPLAFRHGSEQERGEDGALPPFSQKARKGWGTRGSVLRLTTTADLQAYLAGTGTMETEWLGAARQHEEAWFLGLRMNAGVDVAALESEFGLELLRPAMETVERLAEDGLLMFDGERARLTSRGRLISNDVFQEFLQPVVAESSRKA